MFSILILTCNGAEDLSKCLDSIVWCDDIVVLDSFSQDNTVEIAEQRGCRVFQHVFNDMADQRNYAIDELTFKYDWVFHLDQDERSTEELKIECNEVVAKDEKSGYLVPSKMMLWGRWLKHAATYPVYQMRFHKLGEIRFEQFGHGQRETDAKRGVGIMKTPYEHYSFSKGISDWLERHNRYSSQDALVNIQKVKEGKVGWECLVSVDALRRRRFLKRLSYYLPARPMLRFCYMFIIRGGFWDGKPGYVYCLLNAMYEQMVCLKVHEIKRGDGMFAKPSDSTHRCDTLDSRE